MSGIRWFSTAFPGARLDFFPLFFTVPLLPCSRAAAAAVYEQQIPGLRLLLWLPTIFPCYTPTTLSLCGCSRDLSAGMDTNVHLAACTAGRASLSVMGSGQENTFCRLV